MVSALTSVSGRSAALNSSGVRLEGTTKSPAQGMKETEVKELVVDSKSEGRYDLKLDRPYSEFEVRDSRDNLVLYGRNGNVLRKHDVYLSSGSYKIRVTEDDARGDERDYGIELTPSAPPTAAVIAKSGGKVQGNTNNEGFRGLPSDTKLMRVDVAGEYNVRLNTTMASFEIRNSRGDVIASGSNSIDPATVKVRLAPGDTYSITVTQKEPTAQGRAYSLDIAPRINANILYNGGMVMGNMESPPAGMVNKQEHTLNFLSDGDYNFNFLMPNAKFSLLDASGKEVVKGENGAIPDVVEAKEFKKGTYTLKVELGTSAGPGSNWLLNIIAQKKNEQPQPTAVEKLLNERAERLREQAQQPEIPRWTPGGSINVKA